MCVCVLVHMCVMTSDKCCGEDKLGKEMGVDFISSGLERKVKAGF